MRGYILCLSNYVAIVTQSGSKSKSTHEAVFVFIYLESSLFWRNIYLLSAATAKFETN